MIKIFTSQTQSFGEKGEEEAVRFLKKGGFAIVERNVANKYGEIDIVAKKDGVHYFFEVKAGKHGSAVHPLENFHEAKLRKVRVSVEHYCLIHRIVNYQVQGIIVLFEGDGAPRVEIVDLS